MRSAPTPLPSLPLKGRAIAYGGNMYFLLSPRGEEGTHRLGDGKERGSFHRQFSSGDNTKAARPPHPPAPVARVLLSDCRMASPRLGDGRSTSPPYASALARKGARGA